MSARWLLIGALLGLPGPVSNYLGGPVMVETSPASEINLYDVIVLLEVERSDPGRWEADPANALNERRALRIAGRVLEHFQGAVEVRGDQRFAIVVTQYQPVSGWVAEDYGPWSMKELKAGQQVLTFCIRPAPRSTLEHTLEQGTKRVACLPDPVAYPHAVGDVRLAVRLKRSKDYPATLQDPRQQQEVLQQRTKLGPIIARFLIDASADLRPPKLDPLLLALLEARDTPAPCRAEILRLLVDQVTLDEQTPPERRSRLVRAMLSILRESPKGAQVLHERILQADLQAVLLDGDDKPRLNVEATIPTPKDREDLIQSLTDLEMEDDLRELLAKWLRGDLKPMTE